MPEVRNESREERYRHWFRLFDANGDGYIDEQDYVLMSERLVRASRASGANPSGLIEAARNRFAMLKMADTDGDGRVSQAEYLAAALQRREAGSGMDSVHEALARGGFTSFDVDGDGVLDLSDYVLTHVAFGLNPPMQDVVDKFQHFDTNGDGVITFEEFLVNYRKHQLADEPMPFYFCAD
jgi:Ca2+-binding EF-hand superfamily protein